VASEPKSPTPAPPGEKRGPKLIKLSVDEVEKLAALQCTYQDAAGWFSVSLSTFKRRMESDDYREAWERGRDKGHVSLRRNQFDLSKKNATMAIFLGKQWLGQRDITTQEISGRDGGPIAISGPKRALISRIAGIRQRARADDDDRGAD